MVETDENTLHQWKVDNNCLGDITNAVTRQQTAKLRADMDKTTVQIQHIQTGKDTLQNNYVYQDGHIDKATQQSDNKKTDRVDTDTLPALQKQDVTLTRCLDMVNKPDKQT